MTTWLTTRFTPPISRGIMHHLLQLGLVPRDPNEVDRAVDRLDAVVDRQDIAVEEELGLELRRNPRIPRKVQEPAFVGHLNLVDHLAHAIRLPGELERADPVLGRRHAALEKHAALDHAERHVLIEIDIFLEKDMVELTPNGQIVGPHRRQSAPPRW